jgi:hypothetical protein
MQQPLNIHASLQNGKYKVIGMTELHDSHIVYSVFLPLLNEYAQMKEFFVVNLCKRDADNRVITTGSDTDNFEKQKSNFIEEVTRAYKDKSIDQTQAIKDVFVENNTVYVVFPVKYQPTNPSMQPVTAVADKTKVHTQRVTDINSITEKPKRSYTGWVVATIIAGMAAAGWWGNEQGWFQAAAPSQNDSHTTQHGHDGAIQTTDPNPNTPAAPKNNSSSIDSSFLMEHHTDKERLAFFEKQKTTANNLFLQNDWTQAIAYYELALRIKKTDMYCKEQIEICKKNIEKATHAP